MKSFRYFDALIDLAVCLAIGLAVILGLPALGFGEPAAPSRALGWAALAFLPLGITTNVWSGVAIALQSALGTALTVSGITKANPGVVSYTGTDPSNGDYHLLNSVGMYQVDDRIVRVANVNGAGNTYEMESVDSSAFDTFTSGTSTPITFGTSLAVVAGVNVSGGDFAQIDETTIHDNINKSRPGNASPLILNFDCLWDPSDAGLAALKAASDVKAKRALRLTFSNNYRILLYGYVGCTLFPTGQAQASVRTPVTFTSFGKVQAYTS